MKKSTLMRARSYACSFADGFGMGATAGVTVWRVVTAKKLISKIGWGLLGTACYVGQMYSNAKYVAEELEDIDEQEAMEIEAELEANFS